MQTRLCIDTARGTAVNWEVKIHAADEVSRNPSVQPMLFGTYHLNPPAEHAVEPHRYACHCRRMHL